jgi:YesN/AraC family two-component response regulator
MKAVRFVIPKTTGNSFRVQTDEQPYFYDVIHFHPEHQLTLIISGEGTCFIGNHVERFKVGDLFLVGKNVPHVFKSDKAYYAEESTLRSKYMSIFFKNETFGVDFFAIPEMALVKILLETASMGIKVTGVDGLAIGNKVEAIEQIEGFERFQQLLAILHQIASSSSKRVLSTMRYDTPSKDSDNERINKVFAYLSNHFQQDISLDQIANRANMTPNAFCRFFKQRTGKTFSTFLNEVRVEHASKQIATTGENFGTIALSSGFNNISYFNRKFKEVTGLAPLAYRKKHSTLRNL